MCGIAGFIGQSPIPPQALERVFTPLSQRGPDARHAVTWDASFTRSGDRVHAALLHARLSIRDLRAVADQPMSNAAGDIWICYNGEVYGWEHEAMLLRQRGYVFNTTSDTEFILHAYQEWGLDCLPKLRGMFAIALLDLRRRKLYLIRDRMGIKPLVYSHRRGEIVFGSTIRAVLPLLPPERRHLSRSGIDAYLAHRYVPAPHTVFSEIKRVPHAHYIVYDLDRGDLQSTCYWSPAPNARAGFNDRLIESVKLRTVSDRPVGLFLSGGIDSTTLASILAHQGYRDITAYTAAFPGTSFDESKQAAQAASRLGMRHEVLPIEHQIADDFERIVADLDEPFADPSSFPLWYIARAASKHVKVVLGGDGGDELFAGYKRYAKHCSTRWRGRLRLPRVVGNRVNLPGHGAKLWDELSLPWAQAYNLRFSGMPPSLRRYLQPDYDCVAGGYWDMMPPAADRGLTTLLEIDRHNYLPEYILRKGDLCTMAHGLELRVPLLDHHLYEAVIAMPDARRFTIPRKLVLAESCNICTELGLFNQKKRGFNPPIARWLRHELRDRTVNLGAHLEGVTRGQLNGRHIHQLLASFYKGKEDRAEQLLALLVLDTSLTQLQALA